jgi:hypothetical protein
MIVCMADLVLSPDLEAWLSDKAKQLRVDLPEAVLFVLEQARLFEQHERTYRCHPTPSEDPSPIWRDLTAKAHRRADGR